MEIDDFIIRFILGLLGAYVADFLIEPRYDIYSLKNFLGNCIMSLIVMLVVYLLTGEV